MGGILANLRHPGPGDGRGLLPVDALQQKWREACEIFLGGAEDVRTFISGDNMPTHIAL